MRCLATIYVKHGRGSADEMQVFDIGMFNSEVDPTLGMDREEGAKAYKELRDLRSSVKRQQLPKSDLPLDSSDLRATLPSRETCNTFVLSYLTTFERIYRVLDTPKFLEEYDQFWSRPSSVPRVGGFPSCPPLLVPLLSFSFPVPCT